jgi:hypothetical protein
LRLKPVPDISSLPAPPRFMAIHWNRMAGRFGLMSSFARSLGTSMTKPRFWRKCRSHPLAMRSP